MCTQVIDQDDPALGFFHRWVEQFATHYEQVTVICLKEGVHDLPQHVRVLSLGKERGVSRLSYVTRFFQYIWQERNEYDAVFVHMNEEYVLLGALLWKVLGKRVYLWRNHYAGSWRTRCAGWLSTKVFYTSQSSYTAQFKNAVQMPVGVDLERFKPVEGVVRKPRSILFLGRISPSKKPDVLVEALGVLKREGADFTASFYGPVIEGDETYAQRLRERVAGLGIADRVHFGGVLTHAETPRVYQEHAVYINLADSGMYDKTLFEAAASGCVVLSASKDFELLISESQLGSISSETLAVRITDTLSLVEDKKMPTVSVNNNSLESLFHKINSEIKLNMSYDGLIFATLFDYPTRYAHAIHGVKMAQAFVQIPQYYFKFITNEVHEGSLPKNIPVFPAFGRWGRVVKKLHLRTALFFIPFMYVLLKNSFYKKTVVFVNDPVLIPTCVVLKMFFRYSLIIELHSLPKRPTKPFLKRADSIVVLTDSISLAVKECVAGGGSPPVTVIRNAVDTAPFDKISQDLIRETRSELSIGDTSVVIGYIGRFAPIGEDKGIRFLLETLPMLDERIVYLFVGGTKDEIETYSTLVRSLNLQDRVRLVGHVSSEKVPIYIAACDILAYVPSNSSVFFMQETSPMKLFEYMASRRPIIASNLPTVRQIVTDECAYLITPGQKKEFVNTVKSILRDHKDAVRRAEYAYKKVKGNTWLQRAYRILGTLER